MTKVPITRAIVSVYDKAGLDQLATALHQAGVEIVSTGSTAAAIAAVGIPVTPVEELTGFPECLGGRVKTLHPKVHAGLLADLTDPGQAAELGGLAIAPFQLLVSNLYPFEQTVASGAEPAEIIEQIDIGGPAMVRAAAKNHANVAVVTSPDGYDDIKVAVAEGGFTLPERRRLAAQAYARTASYDAAVASWFAASYAPDDVANQTGWPDLVATAWTRRNVLRYGENPHQPAALYTPAASLAAASAGGVALAEQLAGKAMSYNNYVDADAAWRTAWTFSEPCVTIMKHSNPCGIAIAAEIASAHSKAHACDPVSAYGGIIAANRTVDTELAAQVADIFTEVIIAPDYASGVIEILAKQKNLRVLRAEPPASAAMSAGSPGSSASAVVAPEWRQVGGGLLMQGADRLTEQGDYAANWKLVAGPVASPQDLADAEFAWRACRSVKSNAILLASGGASVGVGMGQVNRVDAAKLAVARAGDRAAG